MESLVSDNRTKHGPNGVRMIDNLITWFTQLAWLSLSILVAGLILYVANEAWYATVGRYSKRIELATGIVGTPVHELSHAIMVKLFGMTVVEITWIRKLLIPQPILMARDRPVLCRYCTDDWRRIGRLRDALG